MRSHEEGRRAEGFRRCPVIGGAGMLGYEIARQLVASGRQVRILDLQPVNDRHCDARIGDIRRREDVMAACEGVEVVFQTAAAVWDPRTPGRVFEEVNVDGNRVVLQACRELGIRRLVYTSTIDVVVDGRRPIVDGDESLPYPRRLPRDPYCRTKILAMARRGRYVRLGSGKARFSHAYSENAAHAHLLAAERLYPGSAVAGRPYFVGDHYPAGNLFDFVEPYLEALGLPIPRRSIPYPVAYLLSCIAEVVAPHSNFNRFAVIQTCVDHTYRHDRAERDLGYRPIVSREEAFRRTLAWLRAQGPCGNGQAGSSGEDRLVS